MSSAERKSFRNESRIAELAAAQHGVFTQSQARTAGLSPAAISRRVTGRVWERVLPGVYRAAGGIASSRQEAFAAVLWAGDDALVSHGTAAVEWGIEGVRARKVELWVPSGCSKQSDQVVVHRGTRLDRADRTTLDGMPITTPTRTLIDVSARLEDEALLAALEQALRSRLTTPERLEARLIALRSSGRSGAGRLAALLDARPPDAQALESRLEAKVWRLLSAAALPPCERQAWTIAGGTRYRLDFAWPTARVAVECDGWAYHGRARFEADEMRRADLASARWLIIPVTWKQCTTSPVAIIRRVERALAASADSLRVELRSAEMNPQ